ncbi:MAG: aminotransferase class V-fold PLP-dependent enzyme [Thermoanaerobaculia bacterium]|nr:aminotransferase class V-fold PLP-dependent enzyme [Thermoanaerobaculia bacterium]
MDRHLPAISPWADLWLLDPAVDYLNHGSFGACPKTILEKQSELRLRLEREPVDFYIRALPGLLAEARAALAGFVGADGDDLAFVPNATAGVNAVARSLEFLPGDEILTTDHSYAACRKTLDYAAARTGAQVVVASVPFPLRSEEEVVSAVLSRVTSHTRLAMLDHVTSPTALVFPIELLVRELSARGVDTLVDGAHALGMVPLDLARLGAAYYTANAHKWLCAPKGAAFLHVRKDRQKGLHPISISHGYAGGEARFKDEFDWTGTADPTAILCVPDCIAYLGGLLPGGWMELISTNHALALKARAAICGALHLSAPAPESMLGAMASVPLPVSGPTTPARGLGREALADWMRARGVEPWFYDWPAGRGKLVRVSAQLYNTEEQYVRLAGLLAEALREG